MPPKTKGKKGKKGDDDSWDKTEQLAQPNSLDASEPADDELFVKKPKASAFSAFASAGLDEVPDEDDGGGGLMSLIASASKSKKEKKKKTKGSANEDDPASEQNGIPSLAESQKPVEVTAEDLADEEFGPVKDKKKDKKKKTKGGAKAKDFDELAEQNDDVPPHTDFQKPVEVTAEDLADEEWGPVKEKKKKDKKGKGKKETVDEEEEKPNAEEEVEVKVTPVPTAAVKTEAKGEVDEGEGEAEEPGTKVLSKKEKEKLKKEKEKAKKKAQAAAKKAEAGDAPPLSNIPEAVPDIQSQPTPAADENEDEGEDVPGAKTDAKKKKKKKPAKKDDEPAPAPTPSAAASKKKGGLGALKALMEEKKRLEEEAKRREEEERLRIEEEERRAEEEEGKRQEEKQRRKEKEKAKRELAKKEGRLLTKKQKEEGKMAEIRRQALLASGVQIEGLQQTPGNGPSVAKKVVYGNRKKKGPGGTASPVPGSRPRSPEPTEDSKPSTPAPIPHLELTETNSDVKSDRDTSSNERHPPAVKDSWDASSDEGEAEKPAVKESWDASSDEEGEEESAAKPAAKNETETAKPATKEVPAKAQPAPAKANGPSTTVPAKAVPAKSTKTGQEQLSESEEDSDDSDDSSEADSDDESSDEELTKAQKMSAQKKAEAAARRAKAHEDALAARSKDDLRSPICCILGHVDTGKTKLLDKIRQTNVQEGEAGGITQQIGATYFPEEAIKTKTAVLNKDGTQEYKIPGLLVIDTPGHESFSNLRSRGSSLCNIAILVVDIMHGLEAQTLESLRLLRDKKTPFIVALNKIDRIYGWQPTPDGAFQESLAKQARSVQLQFEDHVTKTIVAFAEEGLNACLYYDNKNFARNVSLVPTSAITGEGVPDMIMLLVNLTQQRMSDRLMYLSELECTVLEVKVIEGLGTTIDVVLSNGILHEGDRIVVCGLNGPIVTQVRALLTPQPLRELRVKSAYVHHKEVKAALGVKITAPDLEKAIAGSRLLVVGPDDDEDELKEEVMSDLTSLFENIDKSGRGVCVQASTLGSLEALLDFLKSSKIPISGINIGPVFKRDIMRASTMLEKAKELACILCFDVPVDKEAEKLADEMGVRLFKADIIYHLFESFKAYNAEITEAKRRDAAPQAVWPCRLKIIAAFCKRDPIILGVDILDGTLRIGTPLAVVKIDPTTGKKETIDLGKITSLEINHKSQEIVKKSQAGAGVAVKIEHAVYQSAKMFGRHFDDKDEVLSHITRQSIDVLKTSFKADVSNEEWLLIRALKPRFGIP